MRLIARAPIVVAGRDYRPGDTFEATPADAEALVAVGKAERVLVAAAPQPQPAAKPAPRK